MSTLLIYQQVKQFLDTIQQESIEANNKLITVAIERLILEIPNTFNKLQPLARSLGVEIHKQLHLLKNDLLFWQVARQTETKAQRWQNIQQRLITLEVYMQQLISLEASADE
jgi:hypothetical protein